MERLTELYQIRSANLELRKRFLRFTSEDIRILKKLSPWADQVADAIAKEFYDHQFGFSETKAFLENFARKESIPKFVEIGGAAPGISLMPPLFSLWLVTPHVALAMLDSL